MHACVAAAQKRNKLARTRESLEAYRKKKKLLEENIVKMSAGREGTVGKKLFILFRS